ncbi:MAG: type II toxin-antitoxin system VapC family toxin [Actinomycetota bacterium]
MITYVDTSTLLKLVIDEDGSDRASTIWTSADSVASAGLIVVEARAALAAAKRGHRLTATQHTRAKRELSAVIADLHTVEATEALISEAAELAEVEGLRGYDAVHLAAALFVEATVLSSADSDLCAAGQRRGLHVANPLLDN